jgi:heme exporter protein D
MNWAEFFHMGGYAFFVWTSYGLTLIVIVANIVSPIMQRKKVILRIKRTIKREAIERANIEQANSEKAGS